MQVGGGDFVYEFEEGWGCLPEEISLGWVAAVAVDSLDRVYVYSRSDNPVVVFDREGNFLCSWGQDLLQDAHGIYIEADDTISRDDLETAIADSKVQQSAFGADSPCGALPNIDGWWTSKRPVDAREFNESHVPDGPVAVPGQAAQQVDQRGFILVVQLYDRHSAGGRR